MNIRKDSTSNIKDYPYYFNNNLTKPAYEQIYLTILAKLQVYSIFSSKLSLSFTPKILSLSQTKRKIGCLTHFHSIRIPFCK
jgi:hypothetical protein